MRSVEEELRALGVRELRPIGGGWQNIGIFEGRVDGRRAAVKVVERRANPTMLRTRVEAVAHLADGCRSVCGPVPVQGRLVNEIGAGYVVAYEFAEGDGPDVGDPGDAARMGHTLAVLHRAMVALPPYDLPDLAAYPGASGGPRQLLHGDFNRKNVRGWRVFDFDDCSYGAVELDLANSLYYVLFEAMTGEDPDQYERFRPAFLDGYGERPGDDVLDGLITRRVRTLRAWLDDPATAPPGVRNASVAWRATLVGFVERHLGP